MPNLGARAVVGTPRWRDTRSAHGAIHTRPRAQIAPIGPPRHGSESCWQSTTLSLLRVIAARIADRDALSSMHVATSHYRRNSFLLSAATLADSVLTILCVGAPKAKPEVRPPPPPVALLGGGCHVTVSSGELEGARLSILALAASTHGVELVLGCHSAWPCRNSSLRPEPGTLRTRWPHNARLTPPHLPALYNNITRSADKPHQAHTFASK